MSGPFLAMHRNYKSFPKYEIPVDFDYPKFWAREHVFTPVIQEITSSDMPYSEAGTGVRVRRPPPFKSDRCFMSA